MSSYSSGRDSSALFPQAGQQPPAAYLIAYIDGGARGNPGPAGYGVVITDHKGQKIATLSEYLGHQTNNYAEYSGLLAALRFAVEHPIGALKVISDSELLVKQLRGEYKVRNPALQELYSQARQLIRALNRFSIQHVLREQNREADRLANSAMDKGMGRVQAVRTAEPVGQEALHNTEFEGVVRGGVIELENASLPEGTRVQVRIKRKRGMGGAGTGRMSSE
jgi:ribonuclease HI